MLESSTPELIDLVVGRQGVGQMLLREHSSLYRLSNAADRELPITPKQAARLRAALSLGARALAENLDERQTITGPKDAHAVMAPLLSNTIQEKFVSIALDARHRVLRITAVATGTVDKCMVHARDVFRDALKENSVAVVLGHSHPSKDVSPSEEDLRLTKRLVEAGRLLGVQVLDHLIVAGDRFTSLRERGAL